MSALVVGIYRNLNDFSTCNCRLMDVEIDALGCMAVSLQQLMAFDAAISIRSTSIMIGIEQGNPGRGVRR